MTEELEFQRQVESNFRCNFAVNTMDLSFYPFGSTIVSQATIMPLLVSHLTSSKLLIGLIPATYSLGGQLYFVWVREPRANPQLGMQTN